MLNRLRTVLVKSFVGAIALGWIFAQAILHFGYTFVAPLGDWLNRRLCCSTEEAAAAKMSLYPAIPEALRFAAIFIVGYLLLRWLYYKPLKEEPDSRRPTGVTQ